MSCDVEGRASGGVTRELVGWGFVVKGAGLDREAWSSYVLGNSRCRGTVNVGGKGVVQGFEL